MLLFRIFLVFSRVALFSWGGGPASLALMQRETTTLGWLTPAEFADAVALGNALPGPIAPQVSAYVGYKLAGLAGAVAAVTGTVLPTTLLMLVMIAFFFGVKDLPRVRAMLTAVRPVVIALLLWTAYDMGRVVFAANGSSPLEFLARYWDKAVIALAALVLLVATPINPALVILAAALLGLLIYR